VSLVAFKITFSPTGTLIFSPLGVVFPFAIVMSMVSVLLLAHDELAELDVGEVAGEEDPLGLPAPVGQRLPEVQPCLCTRPAVGPKGQPRLLNLTRAAALG
jgi:hypothetical protein